MADPIEADSSGREHAAVDANVELSGDLLDVVLAELTQQCCLCPAVVAGATRRAEAQAEGLCLQVFGVDSRAWDR